MIVSLSRFLFPKKCIFCGCPLSIGEDIDICGVCAVRIPYFAGKYLFDGGNSGNGDSGKYCDRIVCALQYTDFVRKTISGYKFHDRIEFGQSLAALLCERILRVENFNSPIDEIREAFDFVTCVPMSRGRLRERGYNQAAILAGHTARYLGLPFERKLLAREDDTLRQSALRRVERYANVRSAFRVDGEKARRAYSRITAADAQSGGALEAALGGARIILIDDIATSMTTINACATALKERGAAMVLGAVLAAP